MHTVLLLGELNGTSALTLEAEIERLCATGVEALTLDLNGLTDIDAIGIAVIVYRRGWCERRGCELALLADTPLVREAFAHGGMSSGQVHLETWRAVLLPMLVDRADSML